MPPVESPTWITLCFQVRIASGLKVQGNTTQDWKRFSRFGINMSDAGEDKGSKLIKTWRHSSTGLFFLLETPLESSMNILTLWKFPHQRMTGWLLLRKVFFFLKHKSFFLVSSVQVPFLQIYSLRSITFCMQISPTIGLEEPTVQLGIPKLVVLVLPDVFIFFLKNWFHVLWTDLDWWVPLPMIRGGFFSVIAKWKDKTYSHFC